MSAIVQASKSPTCDRSAAGPAAMPLHETVERAPELEPVCRALRVYAFDPSRGRRLGNHMVLRVPYEPLGRGPAGRRIAVVDEDLAGNTLHPPLDLDAQDVLRQGGLEPSDTDPTFHQQMVYAVIANLLRVFDRALGREVRFRSLPGEARPVLRVLPHGTMDQNAYYDRETLRLIFGFFPAERFESGRNIPGQLVYACLSHDIVVHEATHAILDGLREDYQVLTSADATAFHEAFADAIAYLHHFTFPGPVHAVMERTGGRLHAVNLDREWDGDGGARVERNPLVVLGEQFAQGIGFGTEIRTALEVPASKDAAEKIVQPHARGALLTGALFEAYFRVYSRRTRGLHRLAGRSRQSRDDLHPDLARRLAADAVWLASRFVELCIRAVAYCPPVDVALGDFLRALLTVHGRMDRDDRDGFRDALIDGFARRGLYPPDVASMSESELLWKRPSARLALPRDVARALRRADAAASRDEVSERALTRFCEEHREALGFVPDLPITLSPYHAIRFAGAELDVGEELVCQATQRVAEEGSGTCLCGGTTLIFGDDGHEAPLRYAITKRLDEKRRGAQRAWLRANVLPERQASSGRRGGSARNRRPARH